MDDFQTIVKQWVESRDTARTQLAIEFGVALSTVDRWWRGVANPHIRIKESIIRWIQAQ